MTYDDGILGLYTCTETQEPGGQPHDTLSLVDRFYFGYDTLGIQRYYTALQAGQQVEAVVNIPGWHEIQPQHHIVIIAQPDGTLDSTCIQYRLVMVQPMHSPDGLRITKLTLERIREDNYADISG